MTNKKMMLLGIDVLYFIMTCILFIYCVGEYELIDLLFLIVYIVYYFRIKIYNWRDINDRLRQVQSKYQQYVF